jgi:hypothetical protein
MLGDNGSTGRRSLSNCVVPRNEISTTNASEYTHIKKKMKQHLLSITLQFPSCSYHVFPPHICHVSRHHISLTLTKATVSTFNWNAATGKLLSIVLSSIDTKWEVWDKVCFAGCILCFFAGVVVQAEFFAVGLQYRLCMSKQELEQKAHGIV